MKLNNILLRQLILSFGSLLIGIVLISYSIDSFNYSIQNRVMFISGGILSFFGLSLFWIFFGEWIKSGLIQIEVKKIYHLLIVSLLVIIYFLNTSYNELKHTNFNQNKINQKNELKLENKNLILSEKISDLNDEIKLLNENNNNEFNVSTKYNYLKLQNFKQTNYSGSFTLFNLSGSIYLKGNFRNGEESGIWTYYEDNFVTEQYKWVPIRIGAICRDGSLSDATGRGACSHHGGVDNWRTENQRIRLK